MSRGSLPVVEFQAMPAIVESPIKDTGGASTGGVAAATMSAREVSGSAVRTSATTAVSLGIRLDDCNARPEAVVTT